MENKTAPYPTPIYHITHMDSLDSMLSNGGMLAKNECDRRGITPVNISYAGIQDRRATTLVPCGAGGTLHDYIPFYFAPRSPMLYTINNNNVPGYDEGQGPIVHIVSSAQAIESNCNGWVFTDGHAIMDLTDFYSDLDDLDKIDWAVMEAKYWRGTLADGDRKRRRQAEFLIHNVFPWNLVHEIGVMTEAIGAWVNSVCANRDVPTVVNVRRNWYY